MNRLKFLGPGLLYAGAAIGVSHLVQSTRAGADFGLVMIWVIVLANLTKYPFFRMAPLYAGIRGESLLHGYFGLGRWAVWTFLELTISTMFAVIAAITVVTAGLAEQICGWQIEMRYWGVILLAISTGILLFGKYATLDRFIKVVILILSATTLIAFLMAINIPDKTVEIPEAFDWFKKEHIFFLIAFVGWMPAPMDISVWHSVWAIEKRDTNRKEFTLKKSLLDFNIGFVGTVFLAICFLVLGAKVFYGSGQEMASSGVAFSGQLINVYSQLLGKWAYFIIAIAAFTTMFSTCITCLDAFPRVVSESLVRVQENEELNKLKYYKMTLMILAIGALGILFFWLQNMKQMVDFATTVSFITTPILASLNYMTMKNLINTGQYKMGIVERVAIWLGFVFLYGFALYYVVQRFVL